MELKFIEAGHPVDENGFGGNWGKFAVGLWTPDQLREPTRFPGCEGQRITNLRGHGSDHVWLFDLQTGEGARFHTNNPAPVDVRHQLRQHQIWVCPMFEPWMVWLWSHIRLHPDWWETLPRTVELPADTPFDTHGHRRSGPYADILDRFDRIEGLFERLLDARTPQAEEDDGSDAITLVTPEHMNELADEAEAGYPIDKLRPRSDAGRRRTDEDVQAARRFLTRRSLDEEQV